MRARNTRIAPFLSARARAESARPSGVVQPMGVRVDDAAHVAPGAQGLPRIDIATRDPDPADADMRALKDRGCALAQRDEWARLAHEIRAADQARAMTAGLQPRAVLLTNGARSDTLAAARTAIGRGEARQTKAALDVLDATLAAAPDCPAQAFVVASTHAEVALLWRGASRPEDLAPMRRDGYSYSMRRASELADAFDPFEWDSPIWASLRCRIIEADAAPSQRVCDDYEDLLDLEPTCPDHLRAMGHDLLPRRFGTLEILDKQARRMAHRTQDIWGLGGYAWVWMGAIETDLAALRRVDVGLFREGLRDIIARFPDQSMVNRLAAFTGVTLPAPTTEGDPGSDMARAFDWIVSDHLQELHPMAWATAATPGRAGRVELEETNFYGRGKARALSTLGDRFADRLRRTGRLVFTESGLEMG